MINEICSKNWTVLQNGDGEYCDYIELYNKSSEEVFFQGYLSDDENELEKGGLLEMQIPSGGHKIIWADGKGNDSDSVNFKISASGEKIFLSDAEGNIIDSIYVPELGGDMAYARMGDGNDSWDYAEPTPNAVNTFVRYAEKYVPAPPLFSKESGFYSEAFWLNLSAEEGTSIYYTLDGSEPTEQDVLYETNILVDDASKNPNVCNAVKTVVENWKEYEPPEDLVDKAVIVRAVAIDGNQNKSSVVTATYFVGLDLYGNTDVLSIVAEPDELFGDDGILVTGREYDEWYLSGGDLEEPPLPNFMKEGKGWEIKGNVQLFLNGKEIMNQKAGIRNQGASNRKKARKRLSIFAREEYGGSSYFDSEIYEGKRTHSFYLNSFFAEAFLQRLVEDRNISFRQSRPVTVFLNGEYWYTSYMLEKYNKYFLEDIYGVDSENIVIIKDGEVSEGEEYANLYEELYELRESMPEEGMTDEQYYEKWNQVIDIQSYIDYLCTNIYLCNMDFSEEKNYMLWRTAEDEGTEYGDGRWRWMLYDLDCIEWFSTKNYEVSEVAEINSFAAQGKYVSYPIDEQSLFVALKHNPIFRKQFVITFMDMINTNFSIGKVEDVLKKGKVDLAWKNNFFLDRPQYMVGYLAEEFGLEGTLSSLVLELDDPEAGTIQVNTCVPDLSDGSWTGRYYTDYPVTLTARTNAGYRFVGWEGDYSGNSESISTELKSGTFVIKAIFEKK